MNNKLSTVALDAVTLKPVVPSNVVEAYPGTEDGHYFAKQGEFPGFIITTRPTSEAFSTRLEDDEEVRVRIIPTEDFEADDLLQILGFARKGDGENIHYSLVTSKAKSLVDGLISVVYALSN